MTLFYTCNDSCEQIRCEDENDAIEEYLDDFLSPKMTAINVKSALPEKITLYEYSPIKLELDSTLKMLSVLDHALELLDEEYGNPEDYPSSVTYNLVLAERKFVSTIIDQYKPWGCERVGSREVDVIKWVKKHRPDWLEDK